MEPVGCADYFSAGDRHILVGQLYCQPDAPLMRSADALAPRYPVRKCRLAGYPRVSSVTAALRQYSGGRQMALRSRPACRARASVPAQAPPGTARAVTRGRPQPARGSRDPVDAARRRKGGSALASPSKAPDATSPRRSSGAARSRADKVPVITTAGTNSRSPGTPVPSAAAICGNGTMSVKTTATFDMRGSLCVTQVQRQHLSRPRLIMMVADVVTTARLRTFRSRQPSTGASLFIRPG